MACAGGFFAPIVRSYVKRSGAPIDTGIAVAVKDRLHALKNPYAHLTLPEISTDMVKASPMLWDTIRYLETCPSSDGACAMIFASERAAAKAPGKPAWVHATAMRSEPTMFAGRDQVNPLAARMNATDLYQKARITNPRAEIDCAEIYVPFSWFEPMWMESMGFAEEGQGWKMTYEGATAIILAAGTAWLFLIYIPRKTISVAGELAETVKKTLGLTPQVTVNQRVIYNRTNEIL